MQFYSIYRYLWGTIGRIKPWRYWHRRVYEGKGQLILACISVKYTDWLCSRSNCLAFICGEWGYILPLRKGNRHRLSFQLTVDFRNQHASLRIRWPAERHTISHLTTPNLQKDQMLVLILKYHMCLYLLLSFPFSYRTEEHFLRQPWNDCPDVMQIKSMGNTEVLVRRISGEELTTSSMMSLTPVIHFIQTVFRLTYN